MKRFFRGVKRTAAAVLATALLITGDFSAFLGLETSSMSKVEAAASKAITYEYYTVKLKNTVPASWLFVGTYLMSAKGVTPQVYQLALKSRDTYKQNIAFYTSELDGSQWKNIKDATDINHITPGSKTVTENDLFPYLITCVVGDDGIPRDPASGNPMDLFSISDPYEMENIPELDKIEAYYQDLLQTDSSDASVNYRKQMLGWFFDYDNLDTYDRKNLDVAAAYEQYQTLAENPEELERIWDEAMRLSPSNFPHDYKDIMMVMRNFPNVRDKVTDKADNELESLDALFMLLAQEKSNEEADAVLYVSSQVDATRQAEIYYNLTQNENITGSFLSNRSDLIEELTLRREELNAQMMEMAASSDRAEAPVKKLRQEINTLKDENEELQNQIDEENAAYKEAAPEEKLDILTQELATLEEEFSDIETEYNRLNDALDESYDESVELDDTQTAIQLEIKELKAKKKENKKAVEEQLADLAADLQEKNDRYTKAEHRREEYYEGVAQIEIWESNIEKLEAAIRAESTHYDALKEEADFYTSSRVTSLVNAGKIYDPEKKTDLDHQVSVSKKIIDTLTTNLESITTKKEELEPVLKQLQEDIALGDSLEGLQQSYSELKEALYAQLAMDDANIDASIEEKRTQLAELSKPFQESLSKLEQANKAYNEYLPVYQAKLQEVGAKHEEVVACENAITQHENLITSLKEQIAVNKSRINAKDAMILPLMPAWDCLEGQIAAMQDEVDELDVLIIKASTITEEDQIRREAYGNTRNSIEKRLELINDAITEAQQAQLEIIKANGSLLAEKKGYEKDAILFAGEYTKEVAAINAEEDEWDEKWQKAAMNAQYNLYSFMNSGEPQEILNHISEENQNIAIYEGILGKMAPYLKNEETLKQKSEYLEQKKTLSDEISSDVDLLLTLDGDDDAANEVRERINSNKAKLADLNQSISLVDGFTIDSNQITARGVLSSSEIELTGIVEMEGVDDTAKKESQEALTEIQNERKKLDEAKRFYDGIIGKTKLTYDERIEDIKKQITTVDDEIEIAKHQYDRWPGWIRKLFGLNSRIEDDVYRLQRRKSNLEWQLKWSQGFPLLCEKNGYSDYVQGSDFDKYVNQKYEELLAKEDEVYAAALNGTPVQNYVNKVNGLSGEAEANRTAWQEKLDAWEALHAEEIAQLKQAVSDAKEKVEQEAVIRQERLELAKKVYESKVSDNQAKIDKINETVSANNSVLQEFQENISAEFGERADELLAMIPGISSYVADTATRRTLAELKTYLEERLEGVDVDVSAAEEQKVATEHLQRVYEKQQERLTSIINEWSKKDTENTKSGNASYAVARENWLNKQKDTEKQQEVLAALEESKTALEVEIGKRGNVEDTHTKERENLNQTKTAYEKLENYVDGYRRINDQIETLESEIEQLNQMIADLQKKIQDNPEKSMLENLDRLKASKDEKENQISALQQNESYQNYNQALSEFYSLLDWYGYSDFDRTAGDFYTYATQKESAWDAEYEAAKTADAQALAEAQNKLNNVMESIRQNTRKLNELSSEEDDAKQNMNDIWADTQKKKELLSSGYKIRIDAQQTVVNNAKTALDEGLLRLQQLKDEIDEYYGEPVADLAIQLAEADALYHSLDYVDTIYITEFGPAPTLLMLQKSAQSGSPSMGRVFANMQDYGKQGSAYEADQDFVELIDSAYELCETAYESYTKQAMSRGETAADYTGFLMSRQVAKNANDKDAALPYLQMIVDLTNIEGGTIVHSLREISLLEGYLVPFAMSDFVTEMDRDRMNDYHYYIRALTDRDTLENAIIFVENRLEYAHSLESTFEDANQSELIEDHITWLENLLRTLKDRALADSDENYDSEEADLLEEKQTALDDGDLKRAKKIDDLLKKKIEGGGDGDNGKSGLLNNPNPLEPTDIDPNTRPIATQEIQDLILEELDNPEYDPTKDYNKFVNIGGPTEELNKLLEKANRPIPSDIVTIPTPKGGDGNGGSNTSANGGDITSGDISDAITDVLGDGDASDEEEAAVVEALSEMEESTGDGDLSDAIDDWINEMISNGNPYVYQQYAGDSSTEYVSMAAVDNCRKTSGFRFVKKNNTELTTMTQIFGGSASYTFTNGSKDVLKNTGEKDTLTVAAVSQQDKYVRDGDDTEYTYLAKADAKKFLYVSGRYIKNTDKAILITPTMEQTIRDLVDALDEKLLLSQE